MGSRDTAGERLRKPFRPRSARGRRSSPSAEARWQSRTAASVALASEAGAPSFRRTSEKSTRLRSRSSPGAGAGS
eukprot:5437588-Heterocapsa_arctica.AAC.1